MSGYSASRTSSQCIGFPTLNPGLSRPPESTSTVARSSASRSGFSQPSGITAVPSSILEVRWVAAASIATGEETPYCRCRSRSQTESKPSRSPSSIASSVSCVPRPRILRRRIARWSESQASPGRSPGSGMCYPFRY